jgi:hypothetical protein
MVGLLALMVNRKKLTDKQLRLKDYLLEHLTNDELLLLESDPQSCGS